MMLGPNGVVFDLVHVSPRSNDSYTKKSVDVTSRTGDALSVRIDPPQKPWGSTPLLTLVQLVPPFSVRRRWKDQPSEKTPFTAHIWSGSYWSTHAPSASPCSASVQNSAWLGVNMMPLSCAAPIIA